MFKKYYFMKYEHTGKHGVETAAHVFALWIFMSPAKVLNDFKAALDENGTPLYDIIDFRRI